jgi:hypothetical protein
VTIRRASIIELAQMPASLPNRKSACARIGDASAAEFRYRKSKEPYETESIESLRCKTSSTLTMRTERPNFGVREIRSGRFGVTNPECA